MRPFNLFVYRFLNEADTFPFVSPLKLEGIAIINNSTTTELLVTINTLVPMTIPVPAGTTYEGEFAYFDTIDVSGSLNFDIELKRS